MANAPEPEEAAETESTPEPKKSGLMKWIIIGVAFVIVVGGGGFAVWIFFFSQGGAQATSKAKAKETDPAKLVGPIVPLPTFIVNLADPGGKRYLKVTLELELSDKAVEKEFKIRRHEIRDKIILSLTSKTFAQIQGVAGKSVLRKELTARLNSILTTGKVKNTYFTEFVVQ